MKKQNVFIVGAARTPIGKMGGILASKTAPELGALAIQTAVSRAQVDPATIYEVIMGHVVQAGVGQAPARQAALGAGLPETVGASAVNKVCGSGLKAVMMAANGIVAEEGALFVAGGMESMSNAPYLVHNARSGLRFGHTELKDAVLLDGLWCSFEDWAMGNAAEFIGRQFEVTREEMDAFAFESHQKAAAATANGRFKAEIVPVEIKTRKGTHRIAIDAPIRASFNNRDYTMTTTRDALAKLRPAFEEDGQVTAGNAPGLNDGGAAVVLASEQIVMEQALSPMAQIVGYTHAAVPPQWIFSAPARAIPLLLKKIGWTVDDVDLFEVNEAFAAQVLANGAEMTQKGIPWDWGKVNVNGGAIALGHPIGASGTRVLVTLLYALKQRGLRRGVAALCLGGGEAVALAVELI